MPRFAGSRRVAFVTNFCPHYRVQTFELLDERIGADYYFYSKGSEDYWLPQHGVQKGDFSYRYLPGVDVGGTRITPTLLWHLGYGSYEAVIKDVNGRFTLPATFLAARLAGIPFVLWTGIWLRMTTAMHRLMFPFLKAIYLNSDAIVVYGEHVGEYLVEEGVAEEKIFVAPHAIDNDAYSRPVSSDRVGQLREEIGTGDDQPLILYVGRLVEEKGVNVLVNAFSMMDNTDAQLIVVGTGALGDELKRLVRSKNLQSRVHFVGYVPPGETRAYYALADLLVLPSVTRKHFREPWGLVVNEAFNQGTPAVVTDAVGAAAGGLVVDHQTGVIVPEGRIKPLAKAMDELLNNPGELQEMGQAAKARVQGWSNSRMVAGFEEALDFVGVSNSW